jgi:hypothetical protein
MLTRSESMMNSMLPDTCERSLMFRFSASYRQRKEVFLKGRASCARVWGLVSVRDKGKEAENKLEIQKAMRVREPEGRNDFSRTVEDEEPPMRKPKMPGRPPRQITQRELKVFSISTKVSSCTSARP